MNSIETPQPLIPVGYMAKRVAPRPTGLRAPHVVDIYAVSSCISPDFAPYIDYWRHNGYWFFDSPQIIRELAAAHHIDLTGCRWFYYEAYPREFDQEAGLWRSFSPTANIATAVRPPARKELAGFDVVSFSMGNAAECSFLSCNHLAETVATNQHCLLFSLEEALSMVQAGLFAGCEPGPSRIIAVYSLPPA